MPQLIEFQDKDVPSQNKNSRWGYLDWSWNTPHLSTDLHKDGGLFTGFVKWLGSQVSGLSPQIHFQRNLLQELLLGCALAIRDIKLVCDTDTEETPLPRFLLKSHMKKEDLLRVGAVVDKIFDLVDNHIK